MGMAFVMVVTALVILRGLGVGGRLGPGHGHMNQTRLLQYESYCHGHVFIGRPTWPWSRRWSWPLLWPEDSYMVMVVTMVLAIRALQPLSHCTVHGHGQGRGFSLGHHTRTRAV